VSSTHPPVFLATKRNHSSPDHSKLRNKPTCVFVLVFNQCCLLRPRYKIKKMFSLTIEQRVELHKGTFSVVLTSNSRPYCLLGQGVRGQLLQQNCYVTKTQYNCLHSSIVFASFLCSVQSEVGYGMGEIYYIHPSFLKHANNNEKHLLVVFGNV